ncbi:MAG TPA: NADH-quinone oxidoreductase subunit J [Candidatus Lokiarchaeia archaeon]|nr:NADH-quinone oxidoreductase subunit J [Candidatus Lokiarchaeia archaeon]
MEIDDQTILTVLTVGLVVSAFMAIYLDEAVYSVASLACTLILLAIIYAIYGAIFAAVFQLAAGVSTLAVLFLTGEMLSEKTTERQSRKKIVFAVIIGLLLSIPTLYLTVPIPVLPSSYPQLNFPEEIWNLRSIDVVLQGVVILIIALGIAIILYEKKERKK